MYLATKKRIWRTRRLRRSFQQKFSQLIHQGADIAEETVASFFGGNGSPNSDEPVDLPVTNQTGLVQIPL